MFSVEEDPVGLSGCDDLGHLNGRQADANAEECVPLSEGIADGLAEVGRLADVECVVFVHCGRLGGGRGNEDRRERGPVFMEGKREASGQVGQTERWNRAWLSWFWRALSAELRAYSRHLD